MKVEFLSYYSNGFGFSGAICDDNLQLSSESMLFGLTLNVHDTKMFQDHFKKEFRKRFICEENSEYQK